MAKNSGAVIGKWAFLIGFVLAIVFGLLESWDIIIQISIVVTLVLMIAGVLVGLLNVDDKEAEPFLISGAVLIIAVALGTNVINAIDEVSGVMNALLLVFVPATIMVALRNIWIFGKD